MRWSPSISFVAVDADRRIGAGVEPVERMGPDRMDAAAERGSRVLCAGDGSRRIPDARAWDPVDRQAGRRGLRLERQAVATAQECALYRPHPRTKSDSRSPVDSDLFARLTRSDRIRFFSVDEFDRDTYFQTRAPAVRCETRGESVSYICYPGICLCSGSARPLVGKPDGLRGAHLRTA